MHLNTSYTHNCSLSVSQTVLPHYHRTRSLSFIRLPLLGSSEKATRKTARVTEAESSRELAVWLSSPSSFRGEGPESAQGLRILFMYLHRVYIFYAHFMLDGLGYSEKSALAHMHTHTLFPTSRNKRGNVAPSLTPGSKREAAQQQLRANLKATSVIRSPGGKAPEPTNRSPPPAHKH